MLFFDLKGLTKDLVSNFTRIGFSSKENSSYSSTYVDLITVGSILPYYQSKKTWIE